jgi:hypothetical protein
MSWWFPLLFIAVWLLVSGGLSVVTGWSSLAKRFRTDQIPQGDTFHDQVHEFGRLGQRRITDLVISPAGLCLTQAPIFRFLHPPLFVPWSEIRLTDPLASGDMHEIELAGSVTMLVSRSAIEAMKPYVSSARV